MLTRYVANGCRSSVVLAYAVWRMARQSLAPWTLRKLLTSYAKHLAAITEVLVADGMSDEQPAGRMLMEKGHALLASQAPIQATSHTPLQGRKGEGLVVR